MAFKAESDDIRSSLSYKLKQILQFRAGDVLCTDPYVTIDDSLLPLDDVLERADILDHRRAAPAVPDVWRSVSRSSTCGTCSGRA